MIKDDRYKKILIISSYAPPSVSGTSLNMYNIFKYFPPKSFVFLTSHQGINDSAIKEGYTLDVKYFYFDMPRLTTIPKSEKSLYQKFKNYLQKTVLLKFLVQTFFILYLPFNIIRYARKIINDENIEVILTYSDNGISLISTYLVHILTKKPFFVHFYDMYYGNNLPFFYRILAYFFEPRIFKYAQNIFVMSEPLSDYYQNKYNRRIVVIHNSVSIRNFKNPVNLKHTGPYKIIFTGAIYWAQLQAIKNLIEAINELQEIDIQFWIYSTYDRDNLNRKGIFESKKIVFHTNPPSHMPAIQKEADILFVPLSFNTRYPKIINTSSPGKTYEYMLSGRPILIHAPENSYIVQYAKKHKFALVVDKNDTKLLKEAIVKLINEKKLERELVDNAFRTVMLHHDAEKNSELFQSFFKK